MTESFKQIQERLSEVIEAKFNQYNKIVGIVEHINADDKYFILKSLDGTKNVECFTDEPLTNMQPGYKVMVRGFVRLYPGSLNRIYILVESMYLESQKEQYKNALNIYYRLWKTLSDKYQPMVARFASVEPPVLIRNIGLVVLPGCEKNLETFKTAFQQKCNGKLFVYRLKEGTIENSLQMMLDYFTKYHKIDIICILSIGLTTQYVCQLSSKNNVVSMLHRKGTPYIVSIVTDGKDTKIMEPLTVQLSNNKFYGIMNFINYIHTNQKRYQERLANGIQIGKTLFLKEIKKRRKIIADAKIYVTNWAGLAVQSKPLVSQLDKLKDMLNKAILREKLYLFDKLKDMLNKAILREKLYLRELQVTSFNHLLKDPRLVLLLSKIIEGQRKVLQERSLGSDMLAKRFAIESKKIENKIVDNSSNDVFSIKNQHQNGDI